MSHLTIVERSKLSVLLGEGYSHRSIAKLLGISHTTVNKEVKRNSAKNGEYIPQEAQEKAGARRFKASSAVKKMTKPLVQMIKERLQQHHSPEQISGRLKLEKKANISTQAIYNYIYSHTKLFKYLRHKGKKYKKSKDQKLAGRGYIPARKGISERPPEVEMKQRFGDLEIDLIVGKEHKSFLLTVYDRSTKYVWIRRIDQKTSDNLTVVLIAIINAIKTFLPVYSITSDNGKEFAGHQEVTKQTGVDFFFARPYKSCDRGGNEHTNGLIREFYPKKTDFRDCCDVEIQAVEHALNTRPRKILNFETPLEAMQKHHSNQVA